MNPSLPMNPKPTAAPPRGAAPVVSESIFNWEMLRKAEIGVPMAVLGVLMAMILPLPPLLLDILISLNISVSAGVVLWDLNSKFEKLS